MFIGHGMLAFAIVASAGAVLGWNRRAATVIGIVAAAFATLPDVDIVYAVFGLVAEFEGLLSIGEVFWNSASGAHRSVTHALPVAAVSAVAFGGMRYRGWTHATTAVCLAILFGLVGYTWLTVDVAFGAIMLVYVVVGIAITSVAVHIGLSVPAIVVAATVGLLTHPFGDFFTGSPPELFWPFAPPVELALVTLHSDPTLHLLGAFFLELVVVWLAVLVYAWLHDWQIVPAVSPRATLGVTYAGAVFVIPAPTLDFSAPFVLSVLAVGLLAYPLGRSGEVPARWRVPITALTAITVAALSYTVAYLVW